MNSPRQEITTIRIMRLAFDISVAAIFTCGCILINMYGKPFIRGYYLNDESIMYPYKENTIEYSLVLVFSVLIPALGIFCAEVVIYFKADVRHLAPSILFHYNYRLPSWLLAVYRAFGLHLTGMVVTELATDIPKFLIGRLRPHFLAVCDPEISILNETSGYITEDICTGNEDKIAAARLSFPSGHTSMAVYASVYLSLYLVHRSRPWPIFRLPVLFLNFTFLYLSVYVAASRLSDYKHHWSDVLAGSILGAAVAIFMTFVFGGKMSPWVAQPSDEEIEARLIASKRMQMYMDDPIFRSQEERAST